MVSLSYTQPDGERVDLRIEQKLFPNNERHYIFPKMNVAVGTINIIYESDADLMTLWNLTHYLNDHGVFCYTILLMPYVPYSRMDRETPNGQPCAIRYLAKFINALNFKEVQVFDPHSSVTQALIDRCIQIPMQPVIDAVIDDYAPDYVVFPDLGASKKYPEVLTLPVPWFAAHKHRDINTGAITEIKLIDAPDLTDKRVLIIDDICAKGGTAHRVAELCREAGASDVRFYASHVESAIMDGKILKDDAISLVYTTNSLIRPDRSKIKAWDLYKGYIGGWK